MQILHFFVLPWRNSVFLLECPVESGIICKTYGFGNGFQGLISFNQPLGGNESALGNTAVETQTQFISEGLGDGTLADIEMVSNFGKGDFLMQMLINIFQHLVKQLRLYKKAKALLADSLTNIKTLYHAGFFNSKTASTILSYGMPAVESLDKIIASRLKIINNQQHNINNPTCIPQ